jgi:O-methyltransferase involved in polyketide biosynthesis
LAEGFQTSFWRLDKAVANPQFRWVSVDLPPVIELREQLLPPSPRITNLAQSALDYSWIDRIDGTDGVFITAEGLLMYLQPDQSMGLITECAKRFPGGQMFFDLPPTIIKKVAPNGIRASKNYRVPPMPFSLSINELSALVGSMPGLTAVHDIPMPKGRGFIFNTVFPGFWGFGPMKRFRGVYALLEFG